MITRLFMYTQEALCSIGIFPFQPDLVRFLQYHHGDNYNVTNIETNQMGRAWLESSSNFVFWMNILTVTRILLKDLYQFSSDSQSCPTLRDPMDWSTPSFTNSRSLLKLMSIESVMPSNHLIFCRPLLLPSILPSIRVFSSVSVLRIRWPRVLEFQL